MPEIHKYYLDKEKRNMELFECWFWAAGITACGVVIYLAYLGVMSLITSTQ